MYVHSLTLHSRVLISCNRRKGRCDGGMPCEWCSSRNLECVFSAFSQKRGPKKKRLKTGNGESEENEEEEILTLDKREQVRGRER